MIVENAEQFDAYLDTGVALARRVLVAAGFAPALVERIIASRSAAPSIGVGLNAGDVYADRDTATEHKLTDETAAAVRMLAHIGLVRAALASGHGDAFRLVLDGLMLAEYRRAMLAAHRRAEADRAAVQRLAKFAEAANAEKKRLADKAVLTPFLLWREKHRRAPNVCGKSTAQHVKLYVKVTEPSTNARKRLQRLLKVGAIRDLD